MSKTRKIRKARNRAERAILNAEATVKIFQRALAGIQKAAGFSDDKTLGELADYVEHQTDIIDVTTATLKAAEDQVRLLQSTPTTESMQAALKAAWNDPGYGMYDPDDLSYTPTAIKSSPIGRTLVRYSLGFVGEIVGLKPDLQPVKILNLMAVVYYVGVALSKNQRP